jgi:cell division protein FtsB
MGVQLMTGAASVERWLYRVRGKIATAAVGVLLLLLAYHVVFGVNGLINYQQKRREARDLEQQIEQLRRDNRALEQRVKALKSDPQAIEKEARERLRYARPGEVVYTLPAAPREARQDTAK